MIKYELKKLFTNKFVAAVFVLTALLITASAIYSFSIYKNNRTSPPYIVLQKGVLTDTTVTTDNIDDLIARYNEIRDHDDSYAVVDTSKREGSVYLHGKYTDRMLALSQKENLTPEEDAELNRLYSYQIKDELYPEFAALRYMIDTFTTKQQDIDPEMYIGTPWESGFIYSDIDHSSPIYTEGYDLRSAFQIENGITFGRNFGWRELLDMGINAVTLIIVVACAIAAIILFTGEYTGKTDALIMASSRGRRKIVQAKLAAGTIFSVIITLYYFAVILLTYGSLFSLNGINTSSQTFINGRILTYGEAFLLMIVCTLFCIIAINITSLAISSLCTKTLPAVLLVFIITLLPFIITFAAYIPNDTIRTLLELLPVNAISKDFGYSHFDAVSVFGNLKVVESHLYIVPAAVIQALICIPIVFLGWKKHKISN